MSLQTYLDKVLGAGFPPSDTARAVGMVGANIPVELILAADATPVLLGSGMGADHSFTLADRFLERSFSRQSRIVAQQWLTGAFQSLDAVIFSRSDDSAQRLYYYLCELQRVGACQGPRPLLYDVARISRASSLSHTIESTQLLAGELGVQEARLPAAGKRVTERAALLMKLAKLRASDAVPLGSLAHRIVRAARTDWSEEFERTLQSWLLSPKTTEPKRRLLLVGSAPTDEQLHVALEASGAVIVGEINEVPQLTASVPSLAGIASQVVEQTRAARELLQSPAEIVKIARELRVDGVILWMLATDTGLAWEAPRIGRAIVEADLPLLMLTSQPDTWDETTLAQAKQFVREVTP